jgi:hypothetical protein
MPKLIAPKPAAVNLVIADIGQHLVDPIELCLLPRRFGSTASAGTAMRALVNRLERDLEGLAYLEDDGVKRAQILVQYDTRPAEEIGMIILWLAARLDDFRDIEGRTRITQILQRLAIDEGLEAPSLIKLVDWAMAPLARDLIDGLEAHEGWRLGYHAVSVNERIIAYGHLRASRRALLSPYLAGELPVRHFETFRLLHADETDERAYGLSKLAGSAGEYLPSSEVRLSGVMHDLEAAGYARISHVSKDSFLALRSPRLARRLDPAEVLFTF